MKAIMDLAERNLTGGDEYPYDNQPERFGWVYRAARAICYDLCDRGGIKHEMAAVDPDVRDEMVNTMAATIAAAAAQEIAANATAKKKVAQAVEDDVFGRGPENSEAWCIGCEGGSFTDFPAYGRCERMTGD